MPVGPGRSAYTNYNIKTLQGFPNLYSGFLLVHQRLANPSVEILHVRRTPVGGYYLLADCTVIAFPVAMVVDHMRNLARRDAFKDVPVGPSELAVTYRPGTTAHPGDKNALSDLAFSGLRILRLRIAPGSWSATPQVSFAAIFQPICAKDLSNLEEIRFHGISPIHSDIKYFNAAPTLRILDIKTMPGRSVRMLLHEWISDMLGDVSLPGLEVVHLRYNPCRMNFPDASAALATEFNELLRQAAPNLNTIALELEYDQGAEGEAEYDQLKGYLGSLLDTWWRFFYPALDGQEDVKDIGCLCHKRGDGS